MNLLEILNSKNYKTDKHTVHRYIQEFYEKEFSKYKNKPIRLLEIGVLEGWSLRLWRDYFTKGEIVGIDIFQRVNFLNVQKVIKDQNIQLEVVDSFNQGEKEVSERNLFIDKNSRQGFDIIIDDALHSEHAQYTTFNNFKSLVNPGGIYIIEDIRVSSIKKLSEIRNIEFLHLNEGVGSRVKKQHIGIIRF